MRILDVAPVLVRPALDGCRVRIDGLLRRLSRKHEVVSYSAGTVEAEKDFVGGGDPPYREIRDLREDVGALCEESKRQWYFLPIAFGRLYGRIGAEALDRELREADVVLVEYPWLFDYCRRRRQGSVVLACHNFESEKLSRFCVENGRRPEREPMWRYAARLERAAVLGADVLTTVSEDDRAGIIETYSVAPERLVVVPNAADTAKLQPAEAAERERLRRELGLEEKPTFVFLAANEKLPHRRALEWIRQVAERAPGFTFLIVGGIASRARRERNVRFTGPRPDVGPYLRAADASICPIEYGGGTKLKLLDALAAGLPTVAFEAGLEGTTLRADERLLVSAPEIDGLVADLRRVIEDRELGARLARTGRAEVVRRYDWDRSARLLEDALAAAVPNGSATP